MARLVAFVNECVTFRSWHTVMICKQTAVRSDSSDPASASTPIPKIMSVGNLSQTIRQRKSSLKGEKGMVRAASGSQSPVDMAFNDIFEVIQELEMPNSAQIVPGRDEYPTEFYKMKNDNLREAKIYGSDINLADIKPEPTESLSCPPFSQISEWVGMSMQLDKTRIKPELELFPRDFSTAYQDDALWSEKLLNETKNLFQYQSALFSRDLSENYRNFVVPDAQESHIVPELENNWFETPEELFVNNEEILPNRHSSSEESYFSEYSSDSEPSSFESKKTDEERSSESPDIYTGKMEAHSPWLDTHTPNSPIVLSTKKPVSVKKEIKRCKSSFKSGRPRLCQFLLELLNNQDKYANLIEWVDKERGVFKFLNSSRVAQEWGERRNKPRMKYENFARSLRTYIAKGILTKPRSKLVYKFASTS